MRMKFLIPCALAFLLSFSAGAQTNAPVVWGYTNGVTYSNGVAIVPPPSGLSVNPADDLQAVLNVIPSKYKSLAAALFTLLLVGGRIWASVNAGGTFSAALGNLIKGKSQAAHNEIAQIKNVLSLPPTPAPPAPTSPVAAPSPAPAYIFTPPGQMPVPLSPELSSPPVKPTA